MYQFIKNKIIYLSSLLLLWPTKIVLASGLQDKLQAVGSGSTGKGGVVKGSYTDKSGNDTVLFESVAVIVNMLLSLLGVIFLVLMIYAGFLWMTAAGEEKKVEKAKDIFSTAIIGLILVIGAYAIYYFIFSRIVFSE